MGNASIDLAVVRLVGSAGGAAQFVTAVNISPGVIASASWSRFRSRSSDQVIPLPKTVPRSSTLRISPRVSNRLATKGSQAAAVWGSLQNCSQSAT